MVLKNEKEAATVSWSVAFKPKKYAHVTSSTVWDGNSVANYTKSVKKGIYWNRSMLPIFPWKQMYDWCDLGI